MGWKGRKSARGSSVPPAPTALVQRTGAGLVPLVHICGSDGVLGCFLLISPSLCLSSGSKAQPELPNPTTYPRAGRTVTMTPSPRLSAHPWGQGSPHSPREVRQSCAAALGLKEMRAHRVLDQLHPGPLEYKSSRVGTRDKDVPRSTSLEKGEQSPLSPASFPQAQSEAQREQFSKFLTHPA